VKAWKSFSRCEVSFRCSQTSGGEWLQRLYNNRYSVFTSEPEKMDTPAQADEKSVTAKGLHQKASLQIHFGKRLSEERHRCCSECGTVLLQTSFTSVMSTWQRGIRSLWVKGRLVVFPVIMLLVSGRGHKKESYKTISGQKLIRAVQRSQSALVYWYLASSITRLRMSQITKRWEVTKRKATG